MERFRDFKKSDKKFIHEMGIYSLFSWKFFILLFLFQVLSQPKVIIKHVEKQRCCFPVTRKGSMLSTCLASLVEVLSGVQQAPFHQIAQVAAIVAQSFAPFVLWSPKTAEGKLFEVRNSFLCFSYSWFKTHCLYIKFCLSTNEWN